MCAYCVTVCVGGCTRACETFVMQVCVVWMLLMMQVCVRSVCVWMLLMLMMSCVQVCHGDCPICPKRRLNATWHDQISLHHATSFMNTFH